MATEVSERELVKKFVDQWQLNVSERNALPQGSLSGSLVVAEICARVEEKGRYPVDWSPDEGFDGGLIERIDADQFKVYWKVECGVSRYALRDIQEFRSLQDAASAYAIRFFKKNFDGIAIDWNR